MKTQMILSLVVLAQLAPSSHTAQSAPARRVLTPPPAPPLPPGPGMRGYEEIRARRADQLRELCISDQGIRTIMDSDERARSAGMASIEEGHSINQELGEAANADPVDVERLGRALAARSAYQAAQAERRDREAVSLLRQLSPQDRAIYALQFTLMRAYPLRPPCRSLR